MLSGFQKFVLLISNLGRKNAYKKQVIWEYSRVSVGCGPGHISNLGRKNF